MIDFISKIVKLNKLNVIGIIRKDDGETFNVLSIKKKGDKIDIVSMSFYTSYEEVLKNIDLKLPILLVIDGKGILNKEVNFNNESDVLWHKNIDHSSIYYTSFKTQHSNFMSFCRKNIADDYNAKFSQSKLTIIDVYIGSFLGALLQGAIHQNPLVSGELSLQFENNGLIGFSKDLNLVKKNYQLEKESISSEIIPLYGVLLHFYIQQKEISKTKSNSSITEEIIYKKLFNFLGIFLLIGFFVSLLASYLLTGYYSSKNVALNLETVYAAQSYDMIVDLEKKKDSKIKILNETGFLTSKFLAFYSYEIIKEVPSDISLTNLNISPLYENIKQNKKVDLEAKTIKLSGETDNEFSLNSWINLLKNIKWAKNFEILSIKRDKKGITHFELKMILKDV